MLLRLKLVWRWCMCLPQANGRRGKKKQSLQWNGIECIFISFHLLFVIHSPRHHHLNVFIIWQLCAVAAIAAASVARTASAPKHEKTLAKLLGIYFSYEMGKFSAYSELNKYILKFVVNMNCDGLDDGFYNKCKWFISMYLRVLWIGCT